MSQETFEQVLNAIYAGLPADIEKDDPQRYQDMINLIEGCVIAALVDRLYYPNPGRLISECRTGFGPWINVPGAAIAAADLSFLKNPVRSKPLSGAHSTWRFCGCCTFTTCITAASCRDKRSRFLFRQLTATCVHNKNARRHGTLRFFTSTDTRATSYCVTVPFLAQSGSNRAKLIPSSLTELR